MPVIWWSQKDTGRPLWGAGTPVYCKTTAGQHTTRRKWVHRGVRWQGSREGHGGFPRRQEQCSSGDGYWQFLARLPRQVRCLRCLREETWESPPGHSGSQGFNNKPAGLWKSRPFHQTGHLWIRRWRNWQSKIGKTHAGTGGSREIHCGCPEQVIAEREWLPSGPVSAELNTTCRQATKEPIIITWRGPLLCLRWARTFCTGLHKAFHMLQVFSKWTPGKELPIWQQQHQHNQYGGNSFVASQIQLEGWGAGVKLLRGGTVGHGSTPMEESEDGPSIRQFSWGELTGLNMMVPVHIGQQKIAAIVDTAAQVTLISTSLREQVLATEGLDYEVVQLRNAQKDSKMPGKLWKHVGFQLGGRKYFMDFVEANIGDNFILGLDFLKGHKCKIDLEEDILEMGTGERIHASMKTNDVRGTYHVSRVLMHKKVSIPANTMKVVAGKLENPAQVPFMLESAAHPKVFAIPLMLEGAPSVSVCMVNLSDSCVTLKRNTEIGQAVEVDAMIDFTTTSSGDSKNVTRIVHVRGNPDDVLLGTKEVPQMCVSTPATLKALNQPTLVMNLAVVMTP